MAILAVGLNHKTAPVAMRERVAFGPDILVGALRSLTELAPICEGLILSTCNRTEIYCSMHTGAYRGMPRSQLLTGWGDSTDWTRRTSSLTFTRGWTARRSRTCCEWPADSIPWYSASPRYSVK